ncbi:hypothetical protein B0H63DRAFT_167043 [Podospora didyma]|uniref:Uncharacterized protein n=1 Tax=Podospora didyma TaxID=330526 RepID=A0AAE0NUE3_9PEZI|nr:hypothetical protein B0H63DRAFT_167043 [Podospora didyma]
MITIRFPRALLCALILSATLALTTNAVVIIPGGVPRPLAKSHTTKPATSPDALLRASAEQEFATNPSAKVIMSTYSAPGLTQESSTNFTGADSRELYPSGDSFVRGAIQAWGDHLHLVIRPDEVWFTILVQMNFYMDKHAEEIRDIFVAHKGQKTIEIWDNDWYSVLRRFQFEIQKNVKTDWLLKWIQPSFSTSTENDNMVANVLMMGLTKTYFKFLGGIICGLPSVTLLGEQADWEALLAKLDRLPEFGKEPAQYAARLRPILSRLVSSFKQPDAKETREFWNSIVVSQSTHICGEPPLYVSGWITGFFFWDASGDAYARSAGNGKEVLQLDGVRYPYLDITKLPVGYAGAPFTMLDFGGQSEFPARVVAGTLGKRIKAGAPPGFADALRRANGDESWIREQSTHGTLQPMSAWMLLGPVEKDDSKDGEKRYPTTDSELNMLARITDGGSCDSGSVSAGSSSLWNEAVLWMNRNLVV